MCYADLLVKKTILPADSCRLRWENLISKNGRNVIADPLWIYNGRTPQKHAKHIHTSQPTTQKVIYVHIGKTGGGTIEKELNRNGIRYTQLHVHALDKIMIETNDAIMISIRDPVNRTESAFNFMNPRNPKAFKFPEYRKKDRNENARFYDCFEDINDYSEKVSSHTKCGNLARIGSEHLGLDTCSYVGGVAEELMKHRDKVHILEQNSLYKDLNYISEILSWHVTFADPHTHQIAEHAVLLNSTSRMKLEEYTKSIGAKDMFNILSSLSKKG
jgi:hypothetical protein